MRFFLETAYRGTQYHGWQRQPNAESVQEVIESSLSTLLGEKTAIMGAGRTDSGVHAKQLFAHFDCHQLPVGINDFIFKMNALLPNDIAVKNLFQVSENAHARFDATQRTYEYWVCKVKNPFLDPFAYRLKYEVDFDRMNQACELLLNHTNFKCFSKSNTDVATFNCSVYKAAWTHHADYSVFTITANRFLRNMVRAIVGTLLEVGQGKYSIQHFQKILESEDRGKAGFSVPAHGLYLTEVLYPSSITESL